MTSAVLSPDYWARAQKALGKADPVMKGIIASYRGETLQCRGDAFFTLARSIVGQQISVKAADSVWSKLATAMGEVHPDALLALADEPLRACGLSRQKIIYLREISAYFAPLSKQPAHYQAMNDAEIIKELVSINGIGRWTAEMFLIFHLMRPNVFPIDDIGLQRGIEKWYFNGEKQPRKTLLAFAEHWAPWNTVATWYLWRSLDPLPVEY